MWQKYLVVCFGQWVAYRVGGQRSVPLSVVAHWPLWMDLKVGAALGAGDREIIDCWQKTQMTAAMYSRQYHAPLAQPEDLIRQWSASVWVTLLRTATVLKWRVLGFYMSAHSNPHTAFWDFCITVPSGPARRLCDIFIGRVTMASPTARWGCDLVWPVLSQRSSQEGRAARLSSTSIPPLCFLQHTMSGHTPLPLLS